MNVGAAGIIGISPWILAYNTARLKGPEIPKAWTDLGDPKWRGQILVADPRGSDAYEAFWTLLHERYGEALVSRISQNIRRVATGVQGAQALAAGEGSILIPALGFQVADVTAKGGPVDLITIELTTGVESFVLLTTRAKAKHPNAARLFAHFIMSPDGNKILNDDPGGFSVYDDVRLPKQYQPPVVGILARKGIQLEKLLGF